MVRLHYSPNTSEWAPNDLLAFNDARSDGGMIKENASVCLRSDYNVNAPYKI